MAGHAGERCALNLAGGELKLNVNKGQLFMTTPSVVQLSTLHIGADGQVIFTGGMRNFTFLGRYRF